MFCATCNYHLTLCICDDCEERIKSLETSPYLCFDWARLRAARENNKERIAALKKQHEDENPTPETQQDATPETESPPQTGEGTESQV